MTSEAQYFDQEKLYLDKENVDDLKGQLICAIDGIEGEEKNLIC